MDENVMPPEGWKSLTEAPPDERVEVLDGEGNIAIAQPTYYPFTVEYREGDEKKAWGWRGTVVHHENNELKWDGGWLVEIGMDVNGFGKVKFWRKRKLI